MQAAVMYKPGDIRLEDVPKPAAKKGEALLGSPRSAYAARTFRAC